MVAFAQTFGGIVIDNPQISQLVQAHINQNMRTTTVKGYRIQIIQNTNRDQVRTEKTKLLTHYSHVRAYETYDSPFFRLRVGDFKTRFDAYKVFAEIKDMFGNAFIVPDEVNVSEL